MGSDAARVLPDADRPPAHQRGAQPGGYQLLHTDADTVVFLRDTEAEQIVVVGYRGKADRPAELLPVQHGGIADGTVFQEVFSGRRAAVEDGALPLPPMEQGAAIWRAFRSQEIVQ